MIYIYGSVRIQYIYVDHREYDDTFVNEWKYSILAFKIADYKFQELVRA